MPNKEEFEEPSFEGYFNFMQGELKKHNIPEEVWTIKIMQKYNTPVGTKAYAEIKKIIDKYPEHFPWEHTYDKIPQEVHDAYIEEAGLGFQMQLFEMPKFGEKRDGIFKSMVDQGLHKPDDRPIEEVIKDWYDMLDKREREERDRKRKNRQIWDKYYKKYNLDYRP